VGDETKNIANVVLKPEGGGYGVWGWVEMRHIGSHVQTMLHDSLGVSARLDA